MITLKCKYDTGSASFRAEMIEGLRVPERRYEAVDGEMLLSGHPDVILHHDADYLLSIPGGVYRLPTPQEQDAKANAQRKAATVEEVAPVVEKPAKKVAG